MSTRSKRFTITKHLGMVACLGFLLTACGGGGGEDGGDGNDGGDGDNNKIIATEMTNIRAGHTTTLLEDGKVLITGGSSGNGILKTAEIYDPATGGFTALSSTLTSDRMEHTATLLSNGTVLIIGGYDGGTWLSSAEVYDPVADSFSTLNSTLNTLRGRHTATLLDNGTVVITGGYNGSAYENSAEVYDPSTGIFTALTNTLDFPRENHTATLLIDGRVLITGGYGIVGGAAIYDSSVIFDPNDNSFTSLTNRMTSPRERHTATLQDDGTVLIIGGNTSLAPSPSISAEIYDPEFNIFYPVSNTLTSPRSNHTATLLSSGAVLIIGGNNGNQPVDTAEEVNELIRVPELELLYQDQFTPIWNDAGSGASLDGHFFSPVTPEGFFALSHYGADVPNKPGRSTFVVRALTPNALTAPVNFVRIWADSGSGADRDGAFWRPVPQEGYVCLGDVVTGYSIGQGYAPPALDIIRCVRQDLVAHGISNGLLWNDQGSGANADVAVYSVKPLFTIGSEAGINFKAFAVVANYTSQPDPQTLYTLKRSAVAKPDLPNGTIDALIRQYGPKIVLHPDEQYLPDDPSAVLDNNAQLCASLVANEGNFDTFSESQLTCSPTTANTLLDDLTNIEANEYAALPDFRIYLKTDDTTKPGDLLRAKAFVRVMPADSFTVEAQFWIYYPFNGSGKVHIQFGNVFTDNELTDPVGRHYGDWESVRLHFNRNDSNEYKLAKVILSRHGDEFPFLANDPLLTYADTHPIVYAARDSHAHYVSTGIHNYNRVAHNDYGVGTLDVDLQDWTEMSSNALDLFQSANYQIVSSEWSVVNNPPSWLNFKYRWGQYEKLSWTYSFDYGFSSYDYDYDEIGSGPTGPNQKGIWDTPL